MEIFNLIGVVFNTLFFAPIVNLLILVYKVLESISFPGALGFAILALTIFIRLLVWPFYGAQLKSAHKMAKLKPHLSVLKEKHKGDKKAFAEAQMALFKEHGVNPAAGCLPTLIQIPIFFALYQAIANVFPGAVAGFSGSLAGINSVLYHPWLHLLATPDANFFSLNLAVKPSQYGFASLFILIPLVTAALTFLQSKMMITPQPQGEKSKDKKSGGMEDTMSSMQSQMAYLMPLMIGYFAFQFPVGLAIYWNAFTIMGIIQQYKISGWGGAEGLWKNNLVKH